MELSKDEKKLVRWIVIWNPPNTIMSCGIYDNYFTALGHVMEEIFNSKSSYNYKGDYFKIGDLFPIDEADYGYSIRIEYKHEDQEEAEVEYYYILRDEE